MAETLEQKKRRLAELEAAGVGLSDQQRLRSEIAGLMGAPPETAGVKQFSSTANPYTSSGHQQVAKSSTTSFDSQANPYSSSGTQATTAGLPAPAKPPPEPVKVQPTQAAPATTNFSATANPYNTSGAQTTAKKVEPVRAKTVEAVAPTYTMDEYFSMADRIGKELISDEEMAKFPEEIQAQIRAGNDRVLPPANDEVQNPLDQFFSFTDRVGVEIIPEAELQGLPPEFQRQVRLGNAKIRFKNAIKEDASRFGAGEFVSNFQIDGFSLNDFPRQIQDELNTFIRNEIQKQGTRLKTVGDTSAGTGTDTTGTGTGTGTSTTGSSTTGTGTATATADGSPASGVPGDMLTDKYFNVADKIGRGVQLTDADLEGFDPRTVQALRQAGIMASNSLTGDDAASALRDDLPSQLLNPLSSTGGQAYGQSDASQAFGRENRTALERSIAEAASQLSIDADTERRAATERINRIYDEQKQRLARQFALTPGGSDSGEAQLQFEQLESARANELVNMESSIDQRVRDELRQNIQTFLTAQESREQSALNAQQLGLQTRQQTLDFLSTQDQLDLARDELGLQEAELYGGEQGVGAETFGVQVPQGGLQGSPQYIAQQAGQISRGFEESYGRKPSASELQTLMSGGQIGGRQTLAARQVEFENGIAAADRTGYIMDPITGQRVQTLAGKASSLQDKEFAESVRRFNAEFLQEMYDPRTGTVRNSEAVRQFNQQMDLSTRELESQIAQNWAQITGETGSEGPLTADDLGVDVSVFADLPMGAILESGEFEQMAERFAELTGVNPTQDQLLSLASGGQINVQGAPTLAQKQLSATVTQQNLDRALAYKDIASREGIEMQRLSQLDEQNDRAWAQSTLNVAQQVGIDEVQFDQLKARFDSIKARDPELTDQQALQSARLATRVSSDDVADGQFFRAVDLFERDYGNAKRQMAVALDMQESQVQRTLDALDNQKLREETVWRGLFEGEGEDVQLTKDDLLGEIVDEANFESINSQFKSLADEVIPAREGENFTDESGRKGKVLSVNYPNQDKLNPDYIQRRIDRGEPLLVQYTTQVGGKTTRHEVEIDPTQLDISDNVIAEDISGLSLSDEDMRARINQRVRNRYGVNLEESEIDSIMSGERVNITSVPEDFVSAYRDDPDLLNTIMGWVTGVTSFRDQPGLWETIGQFAGAATVAGIGAGFNPLSFLGGGGGGQGGTS